MTRVIGKIIAKAREKAGLSQRELAKIISVSNAAISKIERGKRVPRSQILRKISDVLDVNYCELMYMAGRGFEISPLNYFINKYYFSLAIDELNEAEINILGSIENAQKLVNYCENYLNNSDLSEKQKTTLIHTIKDNQYQIFISKETIKLIQNLKTKEGK